MREKDATLQYLSEKIDSLSAEYERAKLNTSHLHDQLDSAWFPLRDLQAQYREYKEQADEEFEQAQYCWSAHDGASAKVHSENGHLLNQRKAEIGFSLDAAHARYDSVKSQFDEAVAYQRGIKAELDQARNAHKTRIEELKAQNLQKQMHWKEKSCGRCGATIRYNDTWEHIPNFCPECKEKFAQEKREREKNRCEKPCRGCGKTIVYYANWEHIPNYCKECYEKGNSWGTPAKTVRKEEGYGILDYSHGIKQQNSKDLSDGEFGEHKWYNPHTGKMGAAGPDYAGRKRKPRYE